MLYDAENHIRKERCKLTPTVIYKKRVNKKKTKDRGENQNERKEKQMKEIKEERNRQGRDATKEGKNYGI